VTELHIVLGVAVIATNLVAGIWGAVAWFARRPSLWFWYLLRSAQVTIVAQVLLGALLLVIGREPDEAIHYMYGTAPLVVNFFAEGMRVGAAQREVAGRDVNALDEEEQRRLGLRIVRREMGIMTVAALLIVAFAIRAAQV
jgi:hypothetical protein